MRLWRWIQIDTGLVQLELSDEDFEILIWLLLLLLLILFLLTAKIAFLLIMD